MSQPLRLALFFYREILFTTLYMLFKESKEEVVKAIERDYEVINTLSVLQNQGIITSEKI